MSSVSNTGFASGFDITWKNTGTWSVLTIGRGSSQFFQRELFQKSRRCRSNSRVWALSTFGRERAAPTGTSVSSSNSIVPGDAYHETLAASSSLNVEIDRPQHSPRKNESPRRAVAWAKHYDATEQPLVDFREVVVCVIVEWPRPSALSGTSNV